MAKRRKPSVAPGADVPLWLESTPLEGVIRVRFLGPYRGALIHKPKPKVQIACPGPETCPTATHRLRSQWRGYAPAEWWRDGQYQDWAPCVFEITESCGEKMQGAELRGTIWRFQRGLGEFTRNEVHCEMIGECDPLSLRPPFSVVPTLCRVFDCVDIALDVPPHKPPRLILTPSNGAPPPDLAETKGRAKLAQISAEDLYRQQIADGTLSEATRRAFPKLIAKLEGELKQQRG